ncbi:MAG: N-6 DNA methylase, partial [Promethearchaeota archaeon]
MVNNLVFKDSLDLDLHYINDVIKNLEVLLVRNNIRSDYRFQQWLTDFQNIYGDKETNLRLYICNSIVYFVGLLFISKFILGEEDTFPENKIQFKDLKNFEKKIKVVLIDLNILELEYFKPFFSISERENLTLFTKLIMQIINILFNPTFPPEYLFDFITQNLIPPILKHSSGEYYTPPFLVKKMVEESYSLGETVLDPCCGSGNFIVGLVKHILSKDISNKDKLEAINRIYGFDINPISIFTSKINLLYLLKEEISNIKLNFYVIDFLF